MKQIIVLVLVLVQMSVFGQKKKSIPPPQIKRARLEAPKIYQPPSKTIYEKLFDDKEHPPLAFKWVVNADSLLLPKQIFSKHLEIGAGTGARLNSNITEDSVTLKKNKVYNPLSHYVKYRFFNVEFNKDIVILTENETKSQMKFKVFLNEKKTEIIKIEDIKSKEIYLPTEFEGATIGM